MIDKIRKANSKQKLAILIVIAVFIVSIILSIKNISQIGKTKADITDLIIRDNVIILYANNTKQSLITKIGTSNISILSDGLEISNNTKIATGNILRYNNQDYQIAVLGDPNKDSIVTGSDVSQVYSAYTKAIQLSKVQFIAADYNGDGVLTGSDVSAVYSLYKNPQQTEENQKYTITFNSNGGSNVSSITKTFGEEIGSLPEPTRTGYTFDGWYTSSSGGTQISSTTKVLANTTYYAHWTIKTFTIEFKDNLPCFNNVYIKKTYGSTLGTLPLAPTCGPEYNEFKGWYTDTLGKGTMVTSSTIVTGNTTYYAYWKVKNYTISFNGNGATSGSVNSISCAGTGCKLPWNSFKKPYFEFMGWNTKSDGTGTMYSDAQAGYKPTKNITLYAIWAQEDIIVDSEGNIWCVDSKGSKGVCNVYQDGEKKSGWVQIHSNWYFVCKTCYKVYKNMYVQASDGYYYWLDETSGVSGINKWTWEKSAKTGKYWFHRVDNSGIYEYSSNRAILSLDQWENGSGISHYLFDASGWCVYGNGC